MPCRNYVSREVFDNECVVVYLG